MAPLAENERADFIDEVREACVPNSATAMANGSPITFGIRFAADKPRD